VVGVLCGRARGVQPRSDRESGGVDRGCANSIATSDGLLSSAPGLTPGEQARFLALQQQLRTQKKGSNRRERTRRKLARLARQAADRRKGWVEQTTTALIRENDLTLLVGACQR